MSVDPLPFTEALQAYFFEISEAESDVAAALREATDSLDNGFIRSSRESLLFLSLLIRLTQTKRMLEIGTFTGYSSLYFAQALAEPGELITCDIDEKTVAIGKPFWAQANVSHKIQSVIAPANDTLATLIQQNQANTFDIAFIDANKSQYPTYYEQCLTLVRPGGIIAIDNVFLQGRVIDHNIQNNMVNAIRKLNQHIKTDPRVTHAVMPLADGITLVLKNH